MCRASSKIFPYKKHLKCIEGRYSIPDQIIYEKVEIAAVKEVVVLVLVEEEAKRNGIKEMLNALIVEKEVTMQKNVGIRRKTLMMKRNQP